MRACTELCLSRRHRSPTPQTVTADELLQNIQSGAPCVCCPAVSGSRGVRARTHAARQGDALSNTMRQNTSRGIDIVQITTADATLYNCN